MGSKDQPQPWQALLPTDLPALYAFILMYATTNEKFFVLNCPLLP